MAIFRFSPLIPLWPAISIVPLSVIVPPWVPVWISCSSAPASIFSVPEPLNTSSLLSVVVPVMSIRFAFLIAPLASLSWTTGAAPEVSMVIVRNAVSPAPSSTLIVSVFEVPTGL